MKQSEIKSYVPEGGWNEETFAKHGKVLIKNFVATQRNNRRSGQKRLKRFLNNLFNYQIEEVISLAQKNTTFKFFKKNADPWTSALTRVFSLGDFQVAGNMFSIQKNIVEGSYKDAKKLLGDNTSKTLTPQSRDRAYKIASRVTKINKTTRDILKKEISKALAEGSTVAETSKRLREIMPRMRRRIPTIVRTEMGRASDEGVKQAMKESKVVTHCSVVGCEKEEPLFTYNGQSTCNVEDVPVGEVDGIDFHINHTGAWVPSKFKTQKEIVAGGNRDLARRITADPANFPSKPRSLSRDSFDSHTKGGIFNRVRREQHQAIKNGFTENRTGTSWGGASTIMLLGGGFLSANLRNNRDFRNENPDGRLAESVDVDGVMLIEGFDEYESMEKASKMGSLEQNEAYLHKECAFLKQDLLEDIVETKLTAVVQGLNAGKFDTYKSHFDYLKSNGHKLEAYFTATSIGEALRKKQARANRLGLDIPKYAIERSLEDAVEVMDYVKRGTYNVFVLYQKGKEIFRYENDKGNILDQQAYEKYLLTSRLYNQRLVEFQDLPFITQKQMINIPDIDYAKDTTEEPDGRDCQIMSVEIITGVDINDSELQPFSEEYKKAWNIIEEQIAEIENAGNKLSYGRFTES